MNGSITIDGEVNTFGEQSSNSRRLNTDSNCNDTLCVSPYEYTLKPLHSARLEINFADIPEGFIYEEHFRIVINTINDGSTNLLTLPDFFAESETNKNQNLQIRIHNMKNVDQVFTFSIDLLHGLFEPYRESFLEKVNVYLYRSDRAKLNSDNTYGFIISSTFLEGITIPYNAPDVEEDPNLFLDMTASLGLPPKRNYDKDVYDTTYWQSRQITSAIMSWVPFFSN